MAFNSSGAIDKLEVIVEKLEQNTKTGEREKPS